MVGLKINLTMLKIGNGNQTKYQGVNYGAFFTQLACIGG